MNDVTTDPYTDLTEREMEEIYVGTKRAYDFWFPDATPEERDEFIQALTKELEI